MAVFYRLSGSLAALSFFGAMFVIITYFSMKVLRKHPTNMVVYLSICDLFFSLKFIVTALYPGSNNLELTTWTCYWQAGWAQFWGTASISWIGMISLNLIIELHKQGFARTSVYGKYYHAFVWTISAITTLIMFFGTKTIGSSISPSGDGTCWVGNPKDPFKLLFFVPLLVYFAVSIITVVVAFIRTSNGVMSDASRRGVMVRMTSYVAVFLLCWSLPLIHRIYRLKYPDVPESPEHPTALSLLDAAGVSIQGFANAMVWLTNPSFFVAFKKRFLDKYFGWLYSSQEKHPLLSEIQDNLADSRQDITVIGQILRKNIITCILLGIQRSMADLVRSDVTQKNYTDVKKYTSDELAGDLSEGPNQEFEFLDYSPLVFAHIREISAVSMDIYKDSMNVAQFLGKLTNEQLAKFSDGRSDSFFIFSPDKRFILKTISHEEAAVLLKMLPSLHHYFRANPHSLITRFYGCHAVRVSHGNLVHVVVMGNVFCTPLAVHECYDLKGSWVNRSAGVRTDPSKLGMDLDLNRRIRLDHPVKAMFLDQLQKDALLLCSLNIMDYSLLLGIHFTDRDSSSRPSSSSTSSVPPGVELVQFINNVPENYTADKLPGAQGLAQLVSQDRAEIYMVGIIDVLQIYDRKKKMERFMKVYVLQKDGEGLSSMPPQPYAKRFAKSMRNITQF